MNKHASFSFVFWILALFRGLENTIIVNEKPMRLPVIDSRRFSVEDLAGFNK